ncbi:MAG: glutathione S-transferase family protein [Sandaracinaceae bacterium]|nr:glutathione S-transferase family protein [Sandaracinaceae bacterium]
MATYTLTYFDFHGGRGEDCRLALHLGGADWADDRLGRGTWAERKPTTPFGGVPVLAVEGKGTLAQSNAILGYLGRTFGMHPADPFEGARHEMILEAVEEMRTKVSTTLAISEPEAKKAAREALAAGPLPAWAAQVEACIGDGPFLAGDALSVTDLKLFVFHKWFASGGLDHVPTDVLAGAPKLTRLCEAVKAHPGVVAYYAART